MTWPARKGSQRPRKRSRTGRALPYRAGHDHEERINSPKKQDPEAWRQGFEAGERGGRVACPYPAATVEAWSWRSGFTEGKAAAVARLETTV